MSLILLIDDKPNILKVMGAVLRKEGWEIETASDGREGLAKAVGSRPDVVVSDIQMEGLSGVELFHALSSRGVEIPFIFITAYASVPEAVNTIRDGAVDYLTKPVDYGVLKTLIKKILSAARDKSRAETSEERFLVGSGKAMNALYRRVEAVADSSATVLVQGENGTGKELVARAIHRMGKFRTGPFVPVNCAAFNVNLLESELFGYEAGAFTGADRRKTGFLEVAAGGTLFLDEISEISADLQVKLLRVLQEKAFTRVGGTELVRADFRLVAATNRDIESMLESGKFRRDLYYRLNVVPILVPALRERFEDLAELVGHFAERVCRKEGLERPEISPEFLELLEVHSWPGNVRELENLVERIIVLYRPARLEPELLVAEVPGLFRPREDDERKAIVEALRLCRGNKTEAAKILDMPRRTLYHKIEKLAVAEDEYGRG